MLIIRNRGRRKRHKNVIVSFIVYFLLQNYYRQSDVSMSIMVHNSILVLLTCYHIHSLIQKSMLCQTTYTCITLLMIVMYTPVIKQWTKLKYRYILNTMIWWDIQSFSHTMNQYPSNSVTNMVSNMQST